MTQAAKIGAHLRESRRHGLDFEQAWNAAVRAHPWPTGYEYGWDPATIRFAKRHFRDGYLRIGIVSTAGALAEPDDWTEDARRVRPLAAAA